MRLTPRLRRGSSLLLLYFTLLVTVVIMSGMLPLYFYLSGSLKRDVDSSNTYLLEQIIGTTDDIIERMDNKAVRISINPRLEMILFRTNNDLYSNRADFITDLNLLSADLDNEQLDAPAIASIALYLRGTDLVLSGRKIYRLEDYADRAFIRSQMAEKDGQRSPLPRKIPRRSGSSDVISVVKTFGAREPYGGMVVINLRREFLAASASRVGRHDNAEFYMTTGDGVIISASPKTAAATLGELGIREVLVRGSAETWEQRLGGKEVILSQGVSKYNQWRYLLAIPKAQVMKPITVVRNVTVAVASVCLVIGFAGSLVLSRSYYKPISRLVQFARSEKLPDGEPKNDFDMLDSSFRRLNAENTANRKLVREFGEAIRNTMLIDLLKGNFIDDRSFARKMADYGVKLEGDSFRVVLFELDDYHSLESASEFDKSLLLYAAYNISQEVIFGHGSGTPVRMNERQIALIVADGGREGNDWLAELLDELKARISQFLKTSTTYTVGSRAASIAELQIAYREAQLLMRSKIFNGQGSIAFYDRERRPDAPELSDDRLNALKTGIIEALKRKDEPAAHLQVDELFLILCDHPSNALSAEYLQFIFLLVWNDAFKLLYSLFGTIPADLDNQIVVYEKLRKCRSLDACKELLKSYCTATVRYFESRSENSKNDYVEGVLEYIRSRFDSDLSLESVAESTHLNPRYLGRLIKQATGKTYHQYVTELRMERAIRLLENPKLRIVDVYEAVGFTNRQSFIRTFKGHTGLTPSEYREQKLHMTGQPNE